MLLENTYSLNQFLELNSEYFYILCWKAISEQNLVILDWANNHCDSGEVDWGALFCYSVMLSKCDVAEFIGINIINDANKKTESNGFTNKQYDEMWSSLIKIGNFEMMKWLENRNYKYDTSIPIYYLSEKALQNWKLIEWLLEHTCTFSINVRDELLKYYPHTRKYFE